MRKGSAFLYPSGALCILVLINVLVINTRHGVIQFDEAAKEKIYAPQTISELQRIVQEAAHSGSKISIVGAGKSQGGQTASSYQNAYRISLHNLNKLIHLDVPQKQVTVEAGMTWKQLQAYIAPHGLAIKAMQSYNDFSIGGSISVNVHGQDLSTGQIISTVLSMQVFLPRGEIITVSREENKDLFYAIIGGYGLIGIIVTATLQLAADALLERHVEVIPTTSLVHYFDQNIRNNKDIVFYSARFAVGSSNFMQKALVITYKKVPCAMSETYCLLPTQQSAILRWLLYATGVVPYLKTIRFEVAKFILSLPETISRNNFLNDSILGLPQSGYFSEYVLQEYFLPYDHVISFIEAFSRLTQKYKINVLNVTARHVLRDTESLLSFSPYSDMCALVIYIKLPRTQTAWNNFSAWTQLIIDQIILHKGTYYLPYHLLATPQQFEAIYPGWQHLVEIRQRYDPHALLSNKLYEKYVH
jgi:decaprenylphospho-beta-D-ribofuranose 2-oxidase